MYNWIRTIIERLKSHYDSKEHQGETLVATDPAEVATLVVTYRVLEGTDAKNLLVKATAKTEFHEGATDLVSNVVNTAADILCDHQSVGRMYGSIVGNMLYVPTELRNKPN